MDLVSISFTCQLPLTGPMYLELHGVRIWMPMTQRDDVWSTTVELPPGAYPYRFHVGDSVTINDCRRTTQRLIDGDVWSVLHVTPTDGPIWIERTTPKLIGVQVCRGLSDAQMPLVVLEHVSMQDFPVILWTQMQQLYQDALLKVFLVRPDHDLAFGGEYLLEHANVTGDFDMKFWLSLSVEPEHAISGLWTFLVQVEGAPVLRRQVALSST